MEIGQWLSGSCHKQCQHGYEEILGNAISPETSPLIEQNVLGNKLIKFEVTGKVQGEQWSNLKIIPYHKKPKVIS
jgi:hypothetical protein